MTTFTTIAIMYILDAILLSLIYLVSITTSVVLFWIIGIIFSFVFMFFFCFVVRSSDRKGVDFGLVFFLGITPISLISLAVIQYIH